MKNDYLIGSLLILLILGIFNPFLMALTMVWSVTVLSLAYLYYYCLGLKGKNMSYNSITTEWIVGTVVLLVVMLLLNDLTTALSWSLFCSVCYGLGILDRQQLLLGE